MKLLALAAAVIAALLLLGGAASASRAPRPVERVALAQAIFDYYWPNKLLSRVAITRIRLTTKTPRRPAAVGSRLVKTYAAITVHAFDASGQDIGYELALAALYVSPTTGWHVFASGSSDVGCENRDYPLGTRRAILKELGVSCSS